ncbi:nucleoside phosphorylase [Seramator thermalis]|uniref:nucleoside phosphorylase n=1 Tax=Seramator thermalis TaxID=2496270 RepID=UPI00101CE1E7|nr:nucleoside phosphorylase [Seramator thermalis]
MRIIPESEFIINPNGSAFHLHIKPEQLADKIVMMGDPDRVGMTGKFFDSIECDIQSREFHTITGMYKGKRITALSHGIGTDNIDIVFTELDALANIDFNTRCVKDNFRQLTVVRVGTSGGMQPYCPVGSFVVSEKSIGFDGLIHYYAGSEEVREVDFEEEFQKQVNWSPFHCSPYVVSADEELIDRIGFDMIRGVTISAIGFYGPQGRYVRLPLADPDLNAKIEAFRYGDYSITNYEMESSAVAGLGKMMGHKAMTVCAIIANRVALNSTANYRGSIEELIKIVLDRI